MTRLDPARLVRCSALLALAGVALTCLSLVVPKPILLVIGMTVGQAIGTLSLTLYLTAVVVDLQRARVLSADDEHRPGKEPE